jgi:HAD superfamily hydrolase (TIGR01459 family)
MPPDPEFRSAQPIAGLGEIADRYDAILCDVWGVLHNGREAFRPASDALTAFRRRGGAVVLITNAPRPSAPIRAQAIKLGVSPDAFDAVVTSGDVTVALVAERNGEPVHHVGPQRDLSLFDAAAGLTGVRPILAPLEDAEYVLCTGLFHDDVETPEDYDERLRAMAARDLPFICANPDLIIHRGSDLVYCAGALAQRYEELGGAAIYAGKPYPPIYRAALAAAEAARGRLIDPSRVLAIGDAMRTDVAGAARQGLDALFISAGIHHDDVHGGGPRAEADRLTELFKRDKLWPIATARSLRP